MIYWNIQPSDKSQTLLTDVPKNLGPRCFSNNGGEQFLSTLGLIKLMINKGKKII